MGILRTVLAIAVVVFHSYKIFGLRLCGGQVAVQSFYMISGFYMALILNEKYKGPGYYKTFIKSRFYRIFPVYWIVLLLTVLISVTGYYLFDKPYFLARYISYKECISLSAYVYFIFENIVIIGQDVMYFLRMDEFCRPEFSYHALSYKHAAYHYLLVPQAWSISIECLFYLLAPFLVTKQIKWQVLIVLISLSLRIVYATQFNLSFDPWTYRFLPFELAFFILGSLSYHYYKTIRSKMISPKIGYALLLCLVTAIVCYNELKIEDTLKNYTFYAIFLCSLPFIFHAFKHNTIDRFIGELSFPIYIIHILIVSLFRNYFFSQPDRIIYYGYTVIGISVILAIIMQYSFINPIEKYRHKKFS